MILEKIRHYREGTVTEDKRLIHLVILDKEDVERFILGEDYDNADIVLDQDCLMYEIDYEQIHYRFDDLIIVFLNIERKIDEYKGGLSKEALEDEFDDIYCQEQNKGMRYYRYLNQAALLITDFHKELVSFLLDSIDTLTTIVEDKYKLLTEKQDA